MQFFLEFGDKHLLQALFISNFAPKTILEQKYKYKVRYLNRVWIHFLFFIFKK